MKQKYGTVQLVAHIEPRKWYTIMLGYGGSESRPFAAAEKTGDKHRGNSRRNARVLPEIYNKVAG